MKIKSRLISKIALLTALVLAVVMLFNVIGIESNRFPQASAAEAGNETQTTADTYDVTFKVYPADAEVKFYKTNGYNAQMQDKIAEKAEAIETITDMGEKDGYRIYKATGLEKGDYSFRGTLYNESIGGMSFSLPRDIEGQTEEPTLILKLWEIKVTNEIDGKKLAPSDYSIEALNGAGNAITMGDGDFDVDNYGINRALVVMKGSSMQYGYQVVPKKNLTETNNLIPFYGIAYLSSAASDLVTNVTLPEGTATFSITVPATVNDEAPEVRLAYQQGYYTRFNVDPVAKTTAEGKTTYDYKISSNNASNYIYTVTAKDKVERAGYVAANQALEITYAETEHPQGKPDYTDPSDPFVLGSNGTDAAYKYITPMGNSLMCADADIRNNVNAKGHLSLVSGQSFLLKTYRKWQIVNSTWMNKMIEPNINYTVNGDEGVIEIQKLDNYSNWVYIRGVKSGTAVISITYDAVNVKGSMEKLDGFYSASTVTAKIVVTVDAEDASAIQLWGKDNPAKVNDSDIKVEDWDSEESWVISYKGEEVKDNFVFKPQIVGGTIDSVELDGKAVTAEKDGSYALTIDDGSHILKVVSGKLVRYQVIRGQMVEPVYRKVVLDEKGNPKTDESGNVQVGDPLDKDALMKEGIKEGEQIQVTCKGLSNQFTKMSGVYNNGGGLSYILEDGTKVTTRAHYSNMGMNAATLTVIRNAAGEMVITLVSENSNLGMHRYMDCLSARQSGTDHPNTELSCPAAVFPKQVLQAAENAKLTEWRNAAKNEVENAYSALKLEDYYKTQQDEIQEIYDDALDQISMKFTQDEIDAIVDAAVNDLKAVLTQKQFDQYKVDAKGKIDESVNPSNYPYSDQNVVRWINEQTKSIISTALNKQTIDDAVANAETLVKAFKDNATILQEEKTAAKDEIANYKNASDYRDAQKTELETAIEEGKAAVDKATSSYYIQRAVDDAKAEIDKIKTDAQLTAEEAEAAEQALEDAKTQAKTGLESYKSAADYRDAEQTRLNELILLGKKAIDGASDQDGINSALSAAKSEIDKLTTNAQWEEAEAFDAKKEAAKAELDDYKDTNDYNDEGKDRINALVSLGKKAIDGATSEAEINSAVAAAKSAMDQVDTGSATADDKGCKSSIFGYGTVGAAVLVCAAGILIMKKKSSNKKDC